MAFLNLEDGREYRRLRFMAGLIPHISKSLCRVYRNRWLQKSGNREKQRKSVSTFYKENPHKKCEKEARRRTRMSLIGDRRLIEQIYARCHELRHWFDVVVDHIIPLSKEGAHSPDNLQIILAIENNRKGAQLDFIPTVVFN
jgi:5-methylcytosine-specific restriction endonuclease McrA